MEAMDPVPGLLVTGDWLADPNLQKVLAVLNSAGEEAYIVGGAVRNALMDRAIADIDIATTCLPPETIERMDRAGFQTVPTGIQHGTILIVTDSVNLEVTTLRRDLETDGRHAVVAFGRSWIEDASRRDFTMNALYCDSQGNVSDPMAGVQDCLDRTVRFIGDADDRLREDYLRLLRFFRFTATYGAGTPDQAGLIACIRARGGMRRISAERIAQETRKLLLAENSSNVCRIFAHSGLVQPTFGCAPNPALLDNVLTISRSCALSVRFETVLAGFLCHGEDGAVGLACRLKLSNLETTGLRVICKLGFETWRYRFPDQNELVGTILENGKDLVLQTLLLTAARLKASEPEKNLTDLLSFLTALDVPVFPIRGQDLKDLGVSPGPDIGRLLQRARYYWRTNDYAPSRDLILEQIRFWIDEK